MIAVISQLGVWKSDFIREVKRSGTLREVEVRRLHEPIHHTFVTQQSFQKLLPLAIVLFYFSIFFLLVKLVIGKNWQW